MKTVESNEIISFGYWVQQRRMALDLTRPALARKVSCSPSTIKKIERDERRPSRQIATLLAEQLLIPLPERERFIAMARGEFVPTPLSAPELISLPSFLWSPDEHDARRIPPLVNREGELSYLASHLEAVVAGRGGMLFITGEAGDGKTVLAQTFARLGQEKYAELVVATGHCNAYTGVGDPYLPFREILELLAGDIEAHWDASTMSRRHAERLWQLVPDTVQALLEVGPDLVDTFVLSAALNTHARAAVSPQSPALLEQLEELIRRHQPKHATTALQQSNLFAQYAHVLHFLARRRPLLLIVDDLQWADAGSISLLFHLSRHLRGQHILLVGLYRAAEVALGRNGERHPLEPLLNELQRTFGEMHVRLNQVDGHGFVDALIDSEPNQLGRSFRDALYRQTAGHPLFTVEMLQGLRARGDVVRNANGQWIESAQLDWRILPARVEGIIKERIERLPSLLQELLQVASVAGESFCAEVIASVHGTDEWRTTNQLSIVLDREQRLIKTQGRQQAGARQLSQYSFRHILFQQYLYNSLDAHQRTYLHRAIAEELEACYGDEANLIAPQLAWHYAIAGNDPRALRYFMVAGDMAAAVYANVEAEGHYRRALALASERPSGAVAGVREQIHPLYTRLGRTLELSSHHDRAMAVYEEMERTARANGDQRMVLASLLARAAIRITVNFARNPIEGRALLEQARTIALELNDQVSEATVLWNLLILSTYTGGDQYERLDYGEQALALARKLELSEQLAFILHDIFYAYAGLGQWQRARSALFEARELWQKLGNLPMMAEACMRLHWTYLVTGAYEQAVTHAEDAYRLGVESHNIDAQALSHFMLGFIYWERGQVTQALTVMEEDIAVAATVNCLTPLVGTRADLGLLYGELGDVERGLALATLARQTAEEQLPILRFWPHAVQVSLHLRQGDVAAAQELVTALADYRVVKERFGYMPFMWVRVGLAHGEFALAQGAFDQVIALMDALYDDLWEADIWYLRPDVLHLKGRALLALENIGNAHKVLQEACSAAERLGSQRALWPILVSLAEAAEQNGGPPAAKRLRQEARVIVEEMAQQMDTPVQDLFLGLPQIKDL
ncbi:MAG: AAA family ATPase [Caldilineaceae bacterium]|nr:AAA family ATPase [Caldilineaceae bacterium]